MMFPLPLPVLAFDFGEVVGIIILVLTVLGWFVRAIKGQGENQPPVRRANPNPGRSEIETFLEELSGNAQKRPPVRPNPPNRPPVAKAPKKPNKQPAGNKPPKAPKPVMSLADKHLSSSNLGSGLRSHVSTYMQTDRVAAEVQQDLKSRIAEDVRTDLGPSTMMTNIAATVASAPVHPLISLLRDPKGVRQAIALQEILQKPRSMRRG
jgi:hypothetical protein